MVVPQEPCFTRESHQRVRLSTLPPGTVGAELTWCHRGGPTRPVPPSGPAGGPGEGAPCLGSLGLFINVILGLAGAEPLRATGTVDLSFSGSSVAESLDLWICGRGLKGCLGFARTLQALLRSRGTGITAQSRRAPGCCQL